MSDLTDEELHEIWEGEHGAGVSDAIAMVEEIKRRRAEHAAGREHVELVVREELRLDFGDDYEVMLDCLARRVADRLSVPVLSEEDVALLFEIRSGQQHTLISIGHLHDDLRGHLRRKIAVLDRLIAAGKP